VITATSLPLDQVPWDELNSRPDRTVFQTREWLEFLGESQRGRPIAAALCRDDRLVGWFGGVVIRRFGVRILGSSFPGWTTPHVGFNLITDVTPSEALAAVERFAFQSLRCLHIEMSDRAFVAEDGEALGFRRTAYETFVTDLRATEAELFKRMEGSCRRCIRKAEREGVVVEEGDPEGFAAQYIAQLEDVFAKQGKVPPYGTSRVEALIRHLYPTRRLLLLRALAPDGAVIATGIYPGHNRLAFFWGNASFRAWQHLRPNEALHWYAMRWWKAHGAEVFDWGGGGDYKRKYGVRPLAIPWFYKSRVGAITAARDASQRLFYWYQRWRGARRRH